MCKSTPTRQAQYLEVIKRSVEQLVAADRFLALEYAMESTGYLNNRSRTTSAELGSAIVALARIVDATTLRGIVSAVVFENQFRRPNREPVNRDDSDWASAAAMAEFAVRTPNLMSFTSRSTKRAA